MRHQDLAHSLPSSYCRCLSMARWRCDVAGLRLCRVGCTRMRGRDATRPKNASSEGFHRKNGRRTHGPSLSDSSILIQQDCRCLGGSVLGPFQESFFDFVSSTQLRFIALPFTKIATENRGTGEYRRLYTCLYSMRRIWKCKYRQGTGGPTRATSGPTLSKTRKGGRKKEELGRPEQANVLNY